MSKTRYDRIGAGYALRRRADPRIAARIDAALGSARSVVNVGAGTGSYEPSGRVVTPVEPSIEMIRQRPADAPVAVRASAESLPFDDGAFDAATAVLTVHHWADPEAGFREMRRVTRGPVVVLTFDPEARPWLTDYLPELVTLDEAVMPAISRFADLLGPVDIAPVPVPHDCTDGFLYAYWRRPEAYLDPELRAGSSAFHAIGAEEGLRALSADLNGGQWQHQYSDLPDLDQYDAGYRLVIGKG